MDGPILVTGGAGFIGSHVVDALASRGLAVRILDSVDPQLRAGPPQRLHPAAEVVVADLRDHDAVARAVRGVGAVCHQAAMVGLERGFADAPGYVARTELGTASLLAALAQTGFSGPLVLASSMVVYGEGGYSCAEHGRVRPAPRRAEDLATGRFEPGCPRCARALAPEPVIETASMDPRSVYAATKLGQEHLCRLFARECGVRHVALRYHNVYGPRLPRDTPYAGVASIFLSALAAGRPPAVFEDGAQLRDFVHVRDVAEANVLALLGDAAGAFNVASGRPRSVGEMAAALSDAAGPAAPAPTVTGEYRLGDVRHVFADATRATAELGFTAQIGFEEGMRELAAAELGAAPPHQMVSSNSSTPTA